MSFSETFHNIDNHFIIFALLSLIVFFVLAIYLFSLIDSLVPHTTDKSVVVLGAISTSSM